MSVREVLALTRRHRISGLPVVEGKRVVGTTRVTHKAGTYVVKVALRKKWRRRYQHQGRKRVTFTLRVVVVGNNLATKVFTSGVIVRL